MGTIGWPIGARAFAPGEISHVFDRFYRAEHPEGTPGTGLGLAISKGIVEAHGGRIWAEARPGGGTIVSLALPTRRPVPDPAANPVQEATHWLTTRPALQPGRRTGSS